MRRAPIVLSATVLGTAGVLLFKPLPASSLEATSASADPTTGSASEATSTPASTSTPTASASSTASAGTKKLTATVTGSAITTRYGTTEVKATIKNGVITEVTVVELNDDDGRSLEISQSAAPALREEVLSKQTAAVDTVSGATYTSLAYEASLQAALDKAGYTAPDHSKASTSTPVVEDGPGGH